MARAIFLNVDLDLHATSGIDRVLAELGERVLVLNHAPDFAVIELTSQPETIDEAIAGFALLIASLSSDAEDTWRAFERKTLNIGIEAGTDPSTSFSIGAKTIVTAAAMGMEVELTLYAPRAGGLTGH